MPKVSFYIRNEDLGAWRAIEHKTEFIHQALGTPGLGVVEKVPLSTITAPTLSKKAQKVVEVALEDAAEDMDVCKHGYLRNGWSCKYGCK